MSLEMLSNEEHVGTQEPLVWENTNGSCEVAGEGDGLHELQRAELGSCRSADSVPHREAISVGSPDPAEHPCKP